MTRSELAAMLDRMDPGAILTLPADALAGAFPEIDDPSAGAADVERFAEEHRCTFCPSLGASTPPQFVKSDVY